MFSDKKTDFVYSVVVYKSFKADTSKAESINLLKNMSFQIYFRLFNIDSSGQLVVIVDPEVIVRDRYSVLIVATDNGLPTQRESSILIEVNFPGLNHTVTPIPPTSGGTDSTDRTTTEASVAAATVLQDDNMLTIILGAVAGLLLVVIIILVVYIIWRYLN